MLNITDINHERPKKKGRFQHDYLVLLLISLLGKVLLRSTSNAINKQTRKY